MFNNSSNLYGNEWLAVVFSNRNKMYGAYVLRAQSSSTLLKSLFIVAPVFILLFVGPMIYANLRKEAPKQVLVTREIETTDQILEVKQEEIKKEKPAAKKQELTPVEPVKTTPFTDNIVLVEETPVVPPTTDELKSAVIGSVASEGTNTESNAAPVSNGDGNGTGTTPGSNGTEIYEASLIEEYPEFPGGMSAWSKFLEKNLRYPYMAQDAGIGGKVYISFVVEKDGSITDVKVVKGIGYGCDDEAVRVIKKSPKWKAGIQNKQNVRVRYNMPIVYTIQ